MAVKKQDSPRHHEEPTATPVSPQAKRTPADGLPARETPAPDHHLTAETSGPIAAGAVSVRGFARQETTAILALVLLVAASYWPATRAGFVWDDVIFTTSDAVRHWSGLWGMWFAPGNAFVATPTNIPEVHYWPVTYTSFWLEHKLWGFDPTGFHVVSLLLHLANTVLLFRLMQRLAVPGPWLIAAVFAVHPLHVESVAWVIERKDLLSALFYLTAVFAWLRFVEAPHWRRYLLMLALFVAGMLSKSMVVTLPAALLILAWWQHGRVTATDLVRVLPLFAVGFSIALADLSFYRARETVAFDFSLLERGLLAAYLLWFYAGKLVWPTDLAVIYPLPAPDAADPVAWGYAVAALALAALLWVGRHRLGRGPLAGALLFAVTLSPVLGFVDFGYMQFSFAADRFQYLAGIGVIAVVAGAAAHAAGRCPPGARKGVQVLVLAVLALLGTLTWHQTGVYRNDFTLFSHIISLNPHARGAYTNLGRGLIDEGRFEESVAATRIVLEQHPDDAIAHHNIGLALNKLGRHEEAERYYRRGLELKPGHTLLLDNLAHLLRNQERHEEALDFYAKALESKPDLATAHAGMGLSLLATDQYEEGIRNLEQAMALYPDWPDTPSLLFSMGQAAEASGRPKAAADYYERALAHDPRHPGALSRLGALHFSQERPEEALELFRAAVEIDPDNAQEWANQGAALYRLERYEEALQSFDRALSLDPDIEAAQTGRAQARTGSRGTRELLAPAHSLREQGRHEEAIEFYAKALESNPGFAQAHAGMGLSLLATGRYEEGIRNLERAVGLAPDSPDTPSLLFAMGQAAEESGRPEAAADYYERTLAHAPRHREALSRLGVLRFSQKRMKEALKLFQAAVEIEPGNAQAWSNQGAALYNLKRYEEALRSFDRALSLDPDIEAARTGREQARARSRGTDGQAGRGG